MTASRRRVTPKGTIWCAVCERRTSLAGARYLRREGYAHRDPVCAGCLRRNGMETGR